jgi:cysteine desulfurase
VRHYLDHNATTPVDGRVLARFLAVEQQCPGNPGSLHAAGRKARAAVEAAREQIAASLSVSVDAVVFTASGTEANNLAVRGLGDAALPVLHAVVEHPSVSAPAAARGAVLWRVDGSGAAVVERPTTAVGLVCLVHGQNEVGTIQDVAAAAALAKQLGVQVHVDAAQSLGRVPLAEVVAVADSVSLSPHKCGGLRGAGVLLVRQPDALRPLLLGGGQERGRRPGTLSPALCAAAALAIELAVQEQPQRAAAMAAARDAFLAAVRDAAVEVAVLTPLSRSLRNTLLLAVPGVDGRNLLPALDLEGVEASQGAACSSGSPRPPAILAAMGLDELAARTCVRCSFGRDHAVGDAADAGRCFARVVARLQKKK